MKKLITIIITVALVLSCAVCIAEEEYDPRSEGYYMVSTTDETALAFANDLAESNAAIYAQFGVKTAVYVFDSMEGADITDDTMEALLSIHESVVGDTSDDMVVLILLDKNDYAFWLGDSIKEKCPGDVIAEVTEAVKAGENDSVFMEAAKVYSGIMFRFMAAGMGAQANGGN